VNVRTILCSALVCIVAIACHKNRGFDDALQDARSARKALLVEFGADWCSDCQELARELQHEPLNTCLHEGVKVFKVDVGEFNRNLDIANELGIDIRNGVIPTAVFLSPATGARTTKIGTTEILSFLKQSCPAASNLN